MAMAVLIKVPGLCARIFPIRILAWKSKLQHMCETVRASRALDLVLHTARTLWPCFQLPVLLHGALACSLLGDPDHLLDVGMRILACRVKLQQLRETVCASRDFLGVLVHGVRTLWQCDPLPHLLRGPLACSLHGIGDHFLDLCHGPASNECHARFSRLRCPKKIHAQDC